MSPTDPTAAPTPPDGGGEEALSDEPEYASVEAFAQYMVDDERATYRPADLIKLMRRTRLSRDAVAAELASYGFGPRAR